MATMAGALVFVLHHLPQLGGHAIVTLAAVLGMAVAVPALVGGRFATRQPRQPIVVVSDSDASTVKRLVHEDLDFCGELHAEALGHGFFVSLGPGFMREYHRSYFDSPHALALRCSLAEHPVGFLVGVLHPQVHARWVLRHRGVGLALRGAGALALRPGVAVSFLRRRLHRYATVWRRHRGQPASEPGRSPLSSEPAVLSHVAVVPGARGTGVGRKLVRSFEATANASGADWATLSTLAGSQGAGDFYSELGWSRRAFRRMPSGDLTEEWTRELAGAR